MKEAWVAEVPGTLAGEDIDSLFLLGGRCVDCGQVFFPTRKNCPNCLHDRPLSDFPLPRIGMLQTFVVANLAPPGFSLPHAQGYIDFPEQGLRIFSLLTHYDEPALKIGCPMAMEIVELGEDTAGRRMFGYRFKPMGTGPIPDHRSDE